MPELPEVETVRRGLAPHVVSMRIDELVLNRPDLRFPFPKDFSNRLTGRTITALNRRAKYLLFVLDSGDTLLSHLGMTGNFRFGDRALTEPTRYHAPSMAQKHDHVVFNLSGSGRADTRLIYSDPRRFGFMDLIRGDEPSPYLAGLGPEPLGNELTAAHLAGRFRGRKTPIKSALLDQRHIAGLGNIYVSEALWRTGIAPWRPAGELVGENGAPQPELDALVRHIRAVLQDAIAAGGSTLKDFRDAKGEAGYFQHAFDVYDRAGEPCHAPGCTGVIRSLVQSGRTSFYCPVCQGEIG